MIHDEKVLYKGKPVKYIDGDISCSLCIFIKGQECTISEENPHYSDNHDYNCINGGIFKGVKEKYKRYKLKL